MLVRRAKALLFAMSLLGANAVVSSDLDHFEKEVRPLLVEHCYECHSAEHKIKGGLRLDHRAGWETGGDSGPAIVPSDPDASRLLLAVSYEDRDLKMPPKKKLSTAEVDTLRQWIAAGAPDPRTAPPLAKGKPQTQTTSNLWSFQPLAKPTPETRRTSRSKHRPGLAMPSTTTCSPLSKGLDLQPVNDAAPEALLRRLHFDLTGLPPTPQQLSSFSPQPSSLQKIVDDLFASPAFAERWAQHWLDITRFAESSGGGRTLPFKDAWRFRDYVIESIYIATSRSTNSSPSTSLAICSPPPIPPSGPANSPPPPFWPSVPPIMKSKTRVLLRMDIIDEQLETIGRSFMGMTIGCARCHDHKFDPISAKDYYAMAGIFRSTQTLRNYTDNVAHWIDTPLPLPPEEEAEVRAKEQQLAQLQSELKTVTAQVKQHQPDADDAAPQKIHFPSQTPRHRHRRLSS
jgi:hypothetical protein